MQRGLYQKLRHVQISTIFMQGESYKELYTPRNIPQNKIDVHLENIDFENILTNEQKVKLEVLPVQIEFLSALENLKENKSPGIDGIPIEF